MSQPLLQSIFSGLLLGSIYALMGLGLTLIYGSLRMLNLSHGTLFMWGGYIAWMVISYLNMPLLVGIVVAFFIMAGVGYLIFPIIIKPLFRSPGWDMTAI